MPAEADVNISTTGPEISRSRKTVLRHLRGDVTRRLGWGLADQVVSSLTNYAVSLYIVHAVGAAQFGAFSLAYVTYGFALSASRGLATDPLMVRFSGTDLPTWRRAVADCTGTAAVMGLAIGACVIAAAAILSGAAGAAFLALGLTLPGLLLQDSWRYSFFALGRGSQAFLNDTIWALTLLPALAVLHAIGHVDVFWFVFAWGTTATIAAAAGTWQARIIPRPAGVRKWVSQHRDLGPRYFAESISQSAAVQIRAYSIGLVLGLAALGSVQAAATLFGPMTILFLGMSLVTIPEAARVLRRSPRHLPLFCLVITGGLSLAGFAWGIILLIAVPRGLGHVLLGPIWRSTYPLLLPQMLFVIGQGIGFGVGTGLHALAAARRSLRLTLFMSVLYVIGSLVGAAVGGTVGAVWGAAVSQWICWLYGWSQLQAAQREAGHQPAAGYRLQSIHPNWRLRISPILAAVPLPDLTMPVRRVRMSATAPRALLATSGIALLAVSAAVGWTLEHHLTRTSPAVGARTRIAGAPGHRDSVGEGAPVITHRRERAKVLRPVSAAAFDPYGDGLDENNQLAYLAIDGNSATAWHTGWYTSPSFGNLKPGTGLLLDMGKTVTVSSVRILLGIQPGADFQVRIGAVASPLTDLHPVAQASDAGGRVSLHLTSPVRGRYLLIWFTQLPSAAFGTFQASVYNVSVGGWA
jgi:O-antigen/teichoic acid export membrane protein